MFEDKDVEIARRKLKARLPASAIITSGPRRHHLGHIVAFVREAGEPTAIWSIEHSKSTWRKGFTAYMKLGCPGARELLNDRIEKFNMLGKKTELLEGPYFVTSYYRAQVLVDGVRYGWRMSDTSSRWLTGDNLDRKAAASHIYDHWDKWPRIDLDTSYGELISRPVDPDGNVWITSYTSVPIDELSCTEFTKVGNNKYRRW